MKQFAALFLCLALILSGCGKSGDPAKTAHPDLSQPAQSGQSITPGAPGWEGGNRGEADDLGNLVAVLTMTGYRIG